MGIEFVQRAAVQIGVNQLCKLHLHNLNIKRDVSFYLLEDL